MVTIVGEIRRDTADIFFINIVIAVMNIIIYFIY